MLVVPLDGACFQTALGKLLPSAGVNIGKSCFRRGECQLFVNYLLFDALPNLGFYAVNAGAYSSVHDNHDYDDGCQEGACGGQ